jgi:hypothetical protein
MPLMWAKTQNLATALPAARGGSQPLALCNARRRVVRTAAVLAAEQKVIEV